MAFAITYNKYIVPGCTYDIFSVVKRHFYITTKVKTPLVSNKRALFWSHYQKLTTNTKPKSAKLLTKLVLWLLRSWQFFNPAQLLLLSFWGVVITITEFYFLLIVRNQLRCIYDISEHKSITFTIYYYVFV